jgi:hypothetical protein
MSISSSPERDSFTKEIYKKKLEENPNDFNIQQVQEFFDTFRDNKRQEEQTEDWKKNNMEYDLRSTDWILQKVREDEVYAQNLYAAMCNREFTKNEVFPILKEEAWGCSWRYAGGIIADMQGKGDYIDWYCSGSLAAGTPGFVDEAVVTDEIRNDLLKLGWLVNDKDDTAF